jgi:mannose-6-phosphate isomerase
MGSGGNKMDRPLRFTPFMRPMVWGGRRLGEALGRPLTPGQHFGESWEVSDHPIHHSVVASGPLAGRSLRELMETERGALLGKAAAAHAVFPWLIKFLDAEDWLSVQVHPDTEAARQLGSNEASKMEAWFVLAAAPGSRIYAGLAAGTDEVRLRDALARGTVAECLHHFEPRPGDSVFLPAGTVHAVGGGVLIAEVQQTSDATFRLFDWNRVDAGGTERLLHVDEALASIHWDQGPIKPYHVELAGTCAVRKELVRCPFFHVDFRRETEPFAVGGEGRIQVFLVLRGIGRWGGSKADEEIRTGQVWVVPAAMPRRWCQLRSPLTLLECTLP